MASRAITKKVYLKPQALLSLSDRFSVYPERRIRMTSTALTQTTKEWEMQDYNQWKIQKFEELAQTTFNLIRKEGAKLEEQNPADVNLMLKKTFKAVHNLWEKAMEEQQRKLLQLGWAWFRDFLRSNGMGDCHDRLLLSISHGGEQEEDTIGFATASPEKGLTSLRRSVALQSPGPFELPRQAVERVVCFTTKDAFLLYDATTGDRSSWVETTTATETRRLGKARRRVESIALGYAPKSDKHKVVCLSTYVKKRKGFAPDTDLSDSGELVVVEVLNVRANTWATGEHEWRRMKGDEPPPTYVMEERIAFMDGPVYSDGRIYWLFRHRRPSMHILEFHVETEVFVSIGVPRFLVGEFMDFSRHLRSMLMEVDGEIALLKSTSDQQDTSSLFICHHVSKCGSIKWTEEKVPVPYAHICPDYSFEALAETDLIFMQSFGLISYYNRKTQESISFEIPASLRDHHFGGSRMIQLR